ncbi:MAG: 30S ribosomal protein S25e [Candidatus Bathyarchaeia archaeon]
MGGKKRLTLSQAEKIQRRTQEPKKKTSRGAEGQEKKILGITPPRIKDDEAVKELRKLKVLTPYSIASKYDLRISVAKDLLESLEKKGFIELVSKNRNIAIYKAK